MNRADARLDQAGLLYGGVLREAFTYGQADPAPMRRAEYATADQLGVAVVAAGLLGGAGVYALAAGRAVAPRPPAARATPRPGCSSGTGGSRGRSASAPSRRSCCTCSTPASSRSAAAATG